MLDWLAGFWKRLGGLPLVGPPTYPPLLPGPPLMPLAQHIIDTQSPACNNNAQRMERYYASRADGELIRSLLFLTNAQAMIIDSGGFVRFLIECPIGGNALVVMTRLIDDPVNIEGWQARLAEIAEAGRKARP